MNKRVFSLVLTLLLALLCLLPAAAPAEEAEPVIVRVGWFGEPFNFLDSSGRRTGYAYEYQRKIAAYTGWKYEYVEGTWPELMQMLKDGRIDLMSDVSFVQERTEYLLYSAIPMGQEFYFLFIAPDNREISTDNPGSLNGKRIGVTAGSIQQGLFTDWMAARGIEAEIVELTATEADSFARLKEGDMDAFITLDSYSNPELGIPLWKIGSSDFYFAVSKKRADLLPALDAALNRIQDENKHYSEDLSAKYLQNSGTNIYLTQEEQSWLESHGPIRVGYQDNYMAFCARDPETGALTGALKDYLEFASGTLINSRPEFTATAYPTAADALNALANGEVDCMFPANLTDYDAETAGLVMSPPLMRTEMDAVIRAEDKQDFLRRTTVRVGVNRGNPNYEMFLTEHFPSWTPVRFADTPACLDEVAARNADCIIISNYRFNDIARQCRRLNLTTVYTGVDMDYCLAVREGSTLLYSILSKMIGQVPESTVNAALTYYSSGAGSVSFTDALMDHLAFIFGGLCAVLLVILLVVQLRLNRQKKTGKKAPSRT